MAIWEASIIDCLIYHSLSPTVPRKFWFYFELLALFPKEIKLKLLINRCTHVWIDMHTYSPPTHTPPVAFELTNSKQVFTEQKKY